MSDLAALRDLLTRDTSAATVHDAAIALCDGLAALSTTVQAHTDAIEGLHKLLTTALDEADDRYLSQCDVNAKHAEEQRLHVKAFDAHAEQLANLAAAAQAAHELATKQNDAIDKCETRIDNAWNLLTPLSRRVADLQTIVAALGATSREHHAALARDPISALEARLAELTAERDEERRLARHYRETYERVAAERDAAETRTVAAIVAWLEQRATEILAPNRHCIEAQHRAAGLTDAVDALRAGTWREP